VVCDDQNACTADSCDPATGECKSVPAVDCDDQNPCTVDACNPLTGQCEHQDVSCEDSNPCTLDRCNPGTGQCEHQGVVCDDQNACTADSCDPATGECKSVPAVDCDDQNPCTVDACNPLTGQCEHQGVVCDDQNACTADSCDPAIGCVNAPVSCDDGDACNGVEACSDGSCVPGNPVVCVASDQCHDVGTCDTQTGACSNPARSDGTACDDGNVCSSGDVCTSGACSGIGAGPVVQASCSMSPTNLNVNARRTTMSLTCSFANVCDPAHPVAIPPSLLDATPVYVSKVDSPADNEPAQTFQDPLTLACPAPDPIGSLYELGITDNTGLRTFSGSNATLTFDKDSDGDCSTLDGDQQDLVSLITGYPDSSDVTICYSGKIGGASFVGCVSEKIRNRGNRP